MRMYEHSVGDLVAAVRLDEMGDQTVVFGVVARKERIDGDFAYDIHAGEAGMQLVWQPWDFVPINRKLRRVWLRALAALQKQGTHDDVIAARLEHALRIETWLNGISATR